jgi:hypothetical protein
LVKNHKPSQNLTYDQNLFVSNRKGDYKISLFVNDRFFSDSLIIDKIIEGIKELGARKVVKIEMEDLDRLLGF